MLNVLGPKHVALTIGIFQISVEAKIKFLFIKAFYNRFCTLASEFIKISMGNAELRGV